MNHTQKQDGRQGSRKNSFTSGSLRGSRTAHTVLLRMAADEARAQRIRELKAAHPELTWRRIADHVGVSERAAVDWAKTGGMEYENAKKLAALFPEITLDWLWAGDKDSTPDVMAALDQDEAKQLRQELEAIKKDVKKILALLTEPTRPGPLPPDPQVRRAPKKK